MACIGCNGHLLSATALPSGVRLPVRQQIPKKERVMKTSYNDYDRDEYILAFVKSDRRLKKMNKRAKDNKKNHRQYA